MASIATASEMAPITEMITNVESPSLLRPACYLDRLPRELRDMIWHDLVHRPTGVVPGTVEGVTTYEVIHGRSIHGYRETRYRFWKEYRYQWDEHRRDSWEDRRHGWLPSSWKQDTEIHWTSKPTAQQQKLIDDEITELPATTDEETGAITQHAIYQRQSLPTEVLNYKQVSIEGFRGIAVMRTCKKFRGEIAEILYSQNTFIFDTREVYPSMDDDAMMKFEKICYRIPGLRYEDGTFPQHWQISRAINRMFDKDDWQPKWLKENPFTFFLYHIGPFNASLITKIKFEGHFRPQWSDNDGNDRRPYTFSQLLPIYQVIPRKVCGNLQEVTLHNGREDRRYIDTTSRIKGPSNKTDEEKVDFIVGKFVKGLPWLKKLRLGDYKSLNDPNEDIDWGTSRRWVEIASKRSTEGMTRPKVFQLVKRTKEQAPNADREGGLDGDSGGQDDHVDEQNTSIVTDQTLNELADMATFSNEGDQGSESHDEDFAVVVRRARGGRNLRGGQGHEGRNRNGSISGHRNERRDVVVGTVANENGRYSYGGSSGRGNGRGNSSRSGRRGRAHR